MQKERCLKTVVRKNFNAPLYSAQKHCGMTNGAESNSPALRHSGMFLSRIWARNTAFTLIELLVVVLIIGILVAVALPQYQKAVDKSRFIKYIQIARGIQRAQEVFYLANGYYSQNLSDLDIEYTGGCMPTVQNMGHTWECPDGFFIDNGSYADGGIWKAKGVLGVRLCPGYNSGYSTCSSHSEAYYGITYDHPNTTYITDEPGSISCTGYTARGQNICKSLESVK